MPRYLLQQWALATIRDEDRIGSHGLELWATPSSHSRLSELEEDDVVFVAGLTNGRLLPICGLTVGRTATLNQLRAEGHDPYPLGYQALAKAPLPRMNLRRAAGEQLSLTIRKEAGAPLARRQDDPRLLARQAFRTPQWIDEPSAQRLTDFLDSVWQDEDDSGVNDPARVSSGLAPRLSVAERKAVEDRAMDVVGGHYEAHGYSVRDVSKEGPWDLTATDRSGEEIHIEVKGTTGSGHAVTVTAGERRHADEFAHPALSIVSGIRLTRGRSPSATGGTLSVHLDPWSINDGKWSPTVYRYEPLASRTLPV